MLWSVDSMTSLCLLTRYAARQGEGHSAENALDRHKGGLVRL